MPVPPRTVTATTHAMTDRAYSGPGVLEPEDREDSAVPGRHGSAEAAPERVEI
jgi:hypothetical protein